ncbi:MAG: Gfo/Idh/MocA family oxidoreductase [Balneolaceae bacterium]|nr:Gfo/Idh/MocA family oxidoreductase [Balneolaceae bacterium]
MNDTNDFTNKPIKKKSSLSRKDFLSSSTLAAAGFKTAPRAQGHPGYKAPSDTLNIACIGVGGMGSSNTESLANLGENIYGTLVMWMRNTPQKLFIVIPKRKNIIASREHALDKEKEIDAQRLPPPYTHAAIAIYAMEMGKHAFVQKPLTRTIYEARRMAEVAEKTGVTTQMGNQGHCFEGTYDIVDYIRHLDVPFGTGA